VVGLIGVYWVSKTIQEQMRTVKRKIRQSRKVTMLLPSEFTFNRGGVKHFDAVLSWFNWGLHNVPVEIDFTACSSANYQALSLLIHYCWKLKQQGCSVSFVLGGNDEFTWCAWFVCSIN
jgi:hypothetical protein